MHPAIMADQTHPLAALCTQYSSSERAQMINRLSWVHEMVPALSGTDSDSGPGDNPAAEQYRSQQPAHRAHSATAKMPIMLAVSGSSRTHSATASASAALSCHRWQGAALWQTAHRPSDGHESSDAPPSAHALQNNAANTHTRRHYAH